MSEAGLDKLAVKQLIETDIEAREVLVLRNAVAALLKLILKLSVLVVQRGEIFVKLVDIGAGLVIELDIARAVATIVGSGAESFSRISSSIFCSIGAYGFSSLRVR